MTTRKTEATQVKRGPVLSAVLVAMMSGPVLADTTNHSQWMTSLNDSELLTQLIIPGTHDSAAINTIMDAGETQDKSITEQLTMGVRFFDARLADSGHTSYPFTLRHGPITLGNFQTVMLEPIVEFLNNNPKEVVLMSVKDEDDLDVQKFMEEVVNAKGSKFYTDASAKTKLSDVRGKIVLFDRMGAGVDLKQYDVQSQWDKNWAWTADFNGDGKLDTASASGNSVYMSLSSQDGYTTETWTVNEPWYGPNNVLVGDFDNNNMADILSFSGSGSTVNMNLSNGSGFTNVTWPATGLWGGAGYNWVADMDGDGKDDVISANGGQVIVKYSEGDGFTTLSYKVDSDWGGAGATWVADYDGNGTLDIASASGDYVYMKLNTGRKNTSTGFVSETWLVPSLWNGSYIWSGDFNGDKKADIATAYGGNVYTYLSTGGAFAAYTWKTSGKWGGSGYTWAADFNGDGRTDIASGSGANLYMNYSTGTGFHSETRETRNEWGNSGFTWVGGFTASDKNDIATAIGNQLYVRSITQYGGVAWESDEVKIQDEYNLQNNCEYFLWFIPTNCSIDYPAKARKVIDFLNDAANDPHNSDYFWINFASAQWNGMYIGNSAKVSNLELKKYFDNKPSDSTKGPCRFGSVVLMDYPDRVDGLLTSMINYNTTAQTCSTN